MTAVLLALGSAALFGGMTVALRLGAARACRTRAARRSRPSSWRSAVAVAASLVRHDFHGAWPFLLTGLLAPGGSQALFTLAVREIGASRTSVAVGAAPLVAVAIALVFLDEPLRLPLVVGALAIVAGGVLLAAERDRPGHLRARGLLFAAGAATMFATRDNLVRALHADASPQTAAAATLLAGAVVAALWTRRAPTRRRAEAARARPASCSGCRTCCSSRPTGAGASPSSRRSSRPSRSGASASRRCSIRHTEGMGRRLALGALLVVVGGAVIGAAR